MKILFYNTKAFEQDYLIKANKDGHIIQFETNPLSIESANLARGYDAISICAADDASAPVMEKLKKTGIAYIAIRSAEYDNVDIKRAKELDIKVANVPDYSSHAVAEHAVAMILALNRKLIIADRQVHQNDYSVDDLIGFDLCKKVVGIIGTGKIGTIMATIMHAFGCEVIAHDIRHNSYLEDQYNVAYTDLKTLCTDADIISIHTPLNEQTNHMINKEKLDYMKHNVILINTANGAVVRTDHIVMALKNKQIGAYGMDVYDKEKDIFHYDHSPYPRTDETLQKLQAMPNVLITPHQAFATREALMNIAATTFYNITSWAHRKSSRHELARNNSQPESIGLQGFKKKVASYLFL